jgi:hypothetical protein
MALGHSRNSRRLLLAGGIFAYAMLHALSLAEASLIDKAQVTLVIEKIEKGKIPYAIDMNFIVTYRGVAGERISGDRPFTEQVLENVHATSTGAESFNFDYQQHEGGSNLTWSFFIGETGHSRVKVRARMFHGILGRNINTVSMHWLGNWPYDVSYIRATLVLPRSYTPDQVFGRDNFLGLRRLTWGTNSNVYQKDITFLNAGQPITGLIVFRPSLLKDFGAFRFNLKELGIFLFFLFFVFVPIFYVLSKSVVLAFRGISVPPKRDADLDRMFEELQQKKLIEKLKKQSTQSNPRDPTTKVDEDAKHGDDDTEK